MSMIRIAAVAALALAVAAPAFANENDSPDGRVFAQVALSHGANGVGLAGENVSATGNALAQSMAVTRGQLAGLAESLALTNNAGTSDVSPLSNGLMAAR